jgi:hypothetical protein
MVILRILVSIKALCPVQKEPEQATSDCSQDMYRIVHTIGSSASLVFLQNYMLGTAEKSGRRGCESSSGSAGIRYFFDRTAHQLL